METTAITSAHTIQNATLAGLILAGADEYGVPEWLGTDQQFATFKRLEDDFEHEQLQDSQNDLIV